MPDRRPGRAACGASLSIALVVSVCFSPVAPASETASDPAKETAGEGGYSDYLNAPHAWFSRRLGNMSRQIDSYFGSPDIYEEVSGTYAEITLEQQFAEAGDSDTGVDFRIKVDLPRTEHRFKLLLESVAEGIDPRDDSPARSRRDSDSDPSSGIFAGLRRVFADTAGFRFTTDAGIKLRTPLEPFARARLRRTWPFGDWQLRFKETLFWFDSDGLGQTTELDLDRRIDERFALRASGRYQWLNETDEWRLDHGVALYQILDTHNSLAYEAGIQATNRPNLRGEQYRVGLRFRRRVHREWLFLSLVPDVIWRREEAFRPEPGLLIEIQMLFGERYLDSRRGRDAPRTP